jgi:hypothetical protein
MRASYAAGCNVCFKKLNNLFSWNSLISAMHLRAYVFPVRSKHVASVPLLLFIETNFNFVILEMGSILYEVAPW